MLTIQHVAALFREQLGLAPDECIAPDMLCKVQDLDIWIRSGERARLRIEDHAVQIDDLRPVREQASCLAYFGCSCWLRNHHLIKRFSAHDLAAEVCQVTNAPDGGVAVLDLGRFQRRTG